MKILHDINADTCERAGLGPKATATCLTWLENELSLLSGAYFLMHLVLF